MNPITPQVIEFLTHPDIPFGSEEDVLLMIRGDWQFNFANALCRCKARDKRRAELDCYKT